MTPSASGRGAYLRQPFASVTSVGVYLSSRFFAFCGHTSPTSPRQRKSPAFATTGPSRVFTVWSCSNFLAQMGRVFLAWNHVWDLSISSRSFLLDDVGMFGLDLSDV